MVYSRRIIESKQNLGASHNIKAKARELRKTMTDTELILWNHLRRRQQQGIYFRRQHPYGIYIFDFYSFQADLVIEIDGKIHLSQKEYDKERTEYLISSGLRVIRFKNEDIELRIDWVIKVINKYLQGKLSTPLALPIKKEEASFSPLGETGKVVKNH